MGIKIKLVPHPSRKHATIQDGRKIHECPKCKDPGNPAEQNKVVEPQGHLNFQPVLCDLCQGPCKPKMVPLGGAFDNICGIELEGAVVGLCHKGPNGFISQTQRGIDQSVWIEIKHHIDKKFGGSCRLDGYAPTFEEHLPDEDEEDEPDTDVEIVDAQ